MDATSEFCDQDHSLVVIAAADRFFGLSGLAGISAYGGTDGWPGLWAE